MDVHILNPQQSIHIPPESIHIHIPPEIVNKHRVLTKNEINIYKLNPHIQFSEQLPSDGYTDIILAEQYLGYPCFINTDENIANATELNEKYIFYVKPPSLTGEPNIYSLYIMHEPEKIHGRRGGKSKKRKTNKSKKSKKNKTNKK